MVGLLSKPDNTGRQKIVVKEEVLMPGYTPGKLFHREAEMQAIVEGVSPLLEGRQPENFFVHGVSGTGKTACIKQALTCLARRSSRVRVVYVNCWRYYTRMAVYSLIIQALEEMLPRRGLATDEVFNRILEVMGKSNVRIIVILDGLDGLFFRKEEKLLYELSRACEGTPFFGLVGISSDPNLLAGEVGGAVRLTEIEFKQYNLLQLTAILEDRAKTGLAPDSWTSEALEACARRTLEQGGSVSAGLSLLWKAVKQAEKAGKSRLMVEDVEKALDTGLRACGASKGLETRLLQSRFGGLSREERLVLGILKEGEKSSSAVYEAFCLSLIRTKRQIRNYLKALEAKKLITLDDLPGCNPMLSAKMIRLSFMGEPR